MSVTAFDVEKFLSRVFLFSELNPAELRLVTAVSYTKRLKKNAPLFHEGDDASHFFVVVHGKFKVFIPGPKGVDITLHVHGMGELIAEGAIFSEKDYPASCIAVQDSLVILIPRKGFIELIAKKPTLSLKFLSAYSKRLRGFVRQIEELSSLDAKQRLVKYLLDNIRSDESLIRLELSKKNLALLLGLSPETLSRAFNVLSKQKLITVSGRDILIKNVHALSSILAG